MSPKESKGVRNVETFRVRRNEGVESRQYHAIDFIDYKSLAIAMFGQ